MSEARRTTPTDRWSVRFFGSLAAIAVGVPAITFGSLAYWDALTTSEVAEATTCAPETFGIVDNGTRYVVETFTTVGTCTWTVPTGVTEADVLIVGGGGGGGSRLGGGGGGGAVIADTVNSLSGTVAVTVGAGGTGAGMSGNVVTPYATDGNASSFAAVTADGGGRGASNVTDGQPNYLYGHSAGPITALNGSAGGGSRTNPAGTPGVYGTRGGAGYDVAAPRGAGGGGGAGTPGGNATGSAGGAGGNGAASSITGTSVNYGGGGGGGHQGTVSRAAGGSGGGGLGGTASSVNGGDASAATGGGGGGGGGTVTGVAGGDGGSGIVVVRYEVPGSARDFTGTFDHSISDIPGTSEYWQAGGNVIALDNDGTIESWVFFDPDENTQYSAWGVTKYLYFGTWAQGKVLSSSPPLDYPIRIGDGWDTRVEMPQNTWTHIAVTWSGTNASLFVNGTLAESTSTFTSPQANSTGASPFRIGAIYDNPSTPGVPWSARWDGEIDEVRIWNDVRTQGEIATAMHTNVAASDANLTAYWDFNQSSGSTVTAIGTTGATATLTAVGSPTFTELGVADTVSRSGWTIHEFERSYITAAGGWTVPANVTAAEVLVVGGGGGGGGTGARNFSGGGGAGGSVTENPNLVLVPAAAVPVTVGSGGRGGSSSSDTERPGDGGRSSFDTTIAEGGGRGGHSIESSYTDASSPTGGSRNGGGGGAQSSAQSGAVGSSGYRSGGDGAGSGTISAQAAGGGAGAGENGADGTSVAGGAGGHGVISSITGSTYGGGGGGGRRDSSGSAGSGGSGGGGAGGKQAAGTDGTSGSGGGGGGAGGSLAAGGRGGSGVVVVAYPDCTASSVQTVTIGGIEYRYQIFTTPDTDSSDGTHNGDLACADTWTVPSGVTSVDVLVVAGGGGGGANDAAMNTGGGGGAGGLVLDSIATTPGDDLPVSVGSGGLGAVWGTDNAGDRGADTVFDSLTAIGGGGGGSLGQSGTSGGSGGGNGFGSGVQVGTGTGGQGSSGVFFNSANTGGNGGGASGSGKAGVASSITGTRATYATGGGPAVNHGSLTVALQAGSGNGGNAGYDYAAGVDHGQAGSSGTVIVRWAADPSDALPVIDLYARYRAGDYDATTKIWADSSGNGRHTLASAVTGTPAVATSTAANGSSTTFPIVTGGTADSLAFPAGVLPSTYTLFHLARYGGAAREQVITATNTNWLSGFWTGKSGVAYQAGSPSSCGTYCWITPFASDLHGDDWVLSSDQKSLYRSQGTDRTTCAGCSAVSTVDLSINRPHTTHGAQVSDWQVGDLLVFDTQLTPTQMRAMENHLGRAYGMTVPGLQPSGVAAATVSGQTDRLTVSWTAPSDPGLTPTSYTIEQSSDGGTTWTTATTSGTVAAAGTTVTGLTGGTDYRFRITADLADITNEFPSPTSTAVAPLVASTTALTWSPSTPTDSQTITLTANVTDGANPIAGVSVAFDDGSATITGCGSVTTDSAGDATCTWGPVSDAAYSVTATATGASIISSSDTQTITVSPSAPGQPTGLTATPSTTGRVNLSWTAPASGQTATDYRIEYRLTGSDSWFTWNPTTSTSVTESVTGLGSGRDYEFRVTALAAATAGIPSAVATATTAISAVIRQFTSVGTTSWPVPPGIASIDYLIVAGGGGGGARVTTNETGGGGGGGGMLTANGRDISSAGSSLSIQVGSGGAGATGATTADGEDGGDSHITGTGLSLVAVGGGGGGGNTATNFYRGNDGGSGGGAVGTSNSAGASTGGSGTSGQGNDGGSNFSVAGRPAGGGGGAGGAGGNASASGAGNGGAGQSSSITGTTLVYAAGGGGGVADSSFSIGTGTSGVSGSGGRNGAGSNGTNGRGGGGGGSGSGGTAGGRGGSGVVVIRHAPAATSTPDLTTASDSGSSNNDNRTGDTTPTFTGTAQHGSTVQLYVDSGSGPTASGSTCTPNSTTYVWTCTTGTLADDDYEVTAVATFTDVNGVTLNEMSASLTVTIDTSLSIDAITLSDAELLSAYTVNLTATGGVAPITWRITSGALPTGVTLSSSGTIAGTPVVTGDFSFTVTATDSNNPQVSDSLALTLTVTLAPQTITFTDPADRAWSAAAFAVNPSSDSGLAVTLTSSTTTVCTVTGFNVTMLRTGTCTLTASQAGDTQYAAATDVTHSFEITAAANTITFADPADRAWSATAFAVSPSSDSGLAVTLISSSTTVCTVTGFNVTMLRTGTCTLTASQAGNTQYAAATDVTHTFEITAATNTIVFAPTFPTATYGDDPFAIAGTASSDLVLAYSTTTPTVCSVSGDASLSNGATNAVVTPLGAGTCTITAAQAGDSRYGAATSVSQSFTIAKAAQTALAFTSASSGVWGDTFTAAVSGGSGSGAVTFSATTGTAGCSINATTGAITYTSAGTCTISVAKAGDTNHLAATPPTPQTLTIAKAAQTLTFTSTVPTTPQPGDTYTLTATSTSGLTPSFSITAGQTTVCTLSAGVVTFVATGSCTVSAGQAGDARFSAAAAQTQTIAVGSLNQSISVTVPDDVEYGSPGFSLDAVASSGLAVTVTSADADVCGVVGVVVTPVAIGDCDLTLVQAGDNRYAAASPVTISFRVVPAVPSAPSIVSVSAGNATATVGFTVPGFTGGVALSAYTVTATPTSGTTITDTTCTESPCTISGLTNGTAYTLTVTANNTAGAGPASAASPAVTPATRATAVTTLAATPGNGTLRVTWGAPADFGGGTFTHYELRIAGDGDAMPVAASATVTSSTAGSYTFTGLDNGTAYNVEIVTITSANQTALTGNTATLSSVPVSTPGEPGALTISEFSPRVIRITWSEPVRDGGAPVTGYTVTITDGDGTTVECGAITIAAGTRAGDCTSDLLELSTSYTVTVAALNRIGAGPAATATHTTPTFTAPTSPPVTTSTDDQDSCPCVFDADGNPVPVDIERTPAGRTPGEVTIDVTPSSISLGGGTGSTSTGQATTWIDSAGRFTAQTPGTIPFEGAGALPGTTVTIFVNGVAVGTATVNADGTWTLDLDLPAGTNGPIDITIVWIDDTGTQRTLITPITVIASGDAATAPRTPTGGTQLTPDPDTAIAIGPNGQRLDATRTTDPATDTITITVGDTTLNITPAENGRLDTTGRLVLGHPARVRVTGDGMLPGATATVWIMSNPQRLGTVTVATNGSIDTTYSIPTGIDPGNHTIQIDTADTEGQPLSIALGLTISPGLLPTTGTDTDTHLAWLTLILALGALVTITTNGDRRRRVGG